MKIFGGIGLMLAMSAASAASLAQGDAYPNKQIRLVVPFAVGGPTDILARILGETLGARLGQSIIIDNRGGAGGAIGTEDVANSPADGYTIGLATSSTHVVNPSCNRNLKYDPIKSFTPIALIGSMQNILVVRAGLNVATFQQFRDLLKKGSDTYSLGTAGPCSFGHVMLEHLNQELGAQIRHIPYRGSGPAVTDLVGGSLDMMMDSYPLLGPHIKTGALKALAVAWPSRLPNLPDTPTFDELGLPAMGMTSWYGIVAPAGLSPDVTARLSKEILSSLQDPKLQKRFADAYIYAAQPNSPEGFKRFLQEQFAKESAFIQAHHMGVD